MSLRRRFGVKPSTFVALGALIVGLVAVDRKVSELEARLEAISDRAASTSVRLDVSEPPPPAPWATAQRTDVLENGAGGEVETFLDLGGPRRLYRDVA